MNTNPLSTVGLMLTLAGLVGAFFNIQLSQWLRDLIAIEQKVKLNKAHGTETQQKAIVECRIEHEKLENVQTYVINALVIGFVVFVLVNGLFMIRSAQADPLYPNINIALWVFLVLFVGVSGWLTYNGWRIAERIKKSLIDIK
jgi:fatty acid desaturase